MPRFPMGCLKPSMSHPDRMRMQAELLKPAYYHALDLEQGGMLIFRHGVPHAGVCNYSSKPRLVLFAMASIDPKVDAEQQYFEWHWLHAFGKGSSQFGNSVYRNHMRGHTPIEREDGEMRQIVQMHVLTRIAAEKKREYAKWLKQKPARRAAKRALRSVANTLIDLARPPLVGTASSRYHSSTSPQFLTLSRPVFTTPTAYPCVITTFGVGLCGHGIRRRLKCVKSV
jgi:hypothetical protein